MINKLGYILSVSSHQCRRHFLTSPVINSRPKIDRSKVPVLQEKEIEEQFVLGSGPGGQKVNRTHNCVVLKHIPTGIVVKVHQDRFLDRNRKIARELLTERLDQHLNGDDCVAAQKERILLAKQKKLEYNKSKHRELKKKFLEEVRKSKALKDVFES